jgi:hypothetical protein
MVWSQILMFNCSKGDPYEEWLMCTKWGENGSKGFVPVKYIEELSPTESAKYTLPVEKRARGRNVATIGREPPQSTSMRQSVQIGAPPLTKSAYMTSSAPYSSGTTNKSTNDPSLAFVDNYERHEKMFRQMMKQREEAFKRLEQRLTEANKEIDHFVKKNEDLIERIKLLDTEIEAERSSVIDPLTTGNITGVRQSKPRPNK